MAKAKKEETVSRAYADHKNPQHEKAKEIFEVMPHIHSIWFDEEGAWRFYETPGTNPVHRHELTAD